MVRAAVVIGVKKTGNLPTLQAVDRCVDLVSKWGEAQPGMGGRVTVISDAGGAAVIADAVRSVIKSVVDLGTVEQLLVYFAGHGVNVRHNEYWLLTNAPEDPNAAVNVRASIDLARDCGIPHVVFISDACRTAADSIQAQDVQGSIIFPNVSSGTEPGHVDVFYASRLGLPALEVRDVKAASDGFEAAFTTVLVAGLSGARSELVQSEGSDNSIGRVHPWPLKRYLQAEVPRFLLQHHVALNISQTPDAIITSAPEAWLAEVSVSARQAVRGITLGEALQAPPPETVPSVVQSLVSGIIRSGSGSNQIQTLRRTPEGERVVVGDVLYGLTLGGSRSNKEMETLTQMPGGEHFMEVLDKMTRVGGAPFPDCQCGFRIKGTKVLQALSPSGRIAIAADGSLVQMWDVPAPATNTLLIFENGTGALLPAIPDFIGSIDYVDGEIINVTYNPPDYSDRLLQLVAEIPELQVLHATIAAAVRLGAFRLEKGGEAAILLRRLDRAVAVDPTLALYATQAFSEMQRRSEIRATEEYLRRDLGLTLFDVSLLAQPTGEAGTMPSRVFPAIPLLSSTWALLDAYRVKLPGRLTGIQRHLTDSFWTVLDAVGVEQVREAINNKEVL